LRKKRKNIVQEEDGPRGESDIHDLSLEDMELKIDIDKVFPNVDQLENTAHQNFQMEIIETENFDEEESFSFQSVAFDRESKNLVIEKRDVRIRRGNIVQILTYETCALPKFPKYTKKLEML
jgi:hypothetical protein